MSVPRRAALGAAALAATAALALAPLSAIAADGDAQPDSSAEGQFLDGTIAGADLGAVVAVEPATASNDGTQPTAEERNPLDLTAVSAVTVSGPPVDAASGAPGADAGVLGQYAVARPDGTAFASSGLIGANGAIGVSQGPGTTATIDLGALLGSRLDPALAGLRLELRGIAAEAEAELAGYRGDYTLADARLVLDAPAAASAPDRVASALAPLQDAAAALGGPDGPLAIALDAALAGQNAALAGADVDATVDLDLSGILAGLDDTVLSDPAITIDLGSGTISVDLAALPASPGFNDLAPGTELLSAPVVDSIASGVARLLDSWLDGIEDATRAAVLSARVSVDAHLGVLEDVQTGTTTNEVVHTVTQVVDAGTGEVLGVLDPATGAVESLVPGVGGDELAALLAGAPGAVDALGGLLGGGTSVPELTTRVVETVEQVQVPVTSSLATSADVHIGGAIRDLQSGSVDASADLQVLGAPISVDASLLSGPVVDAVLGALLGDGGALPTALGLLPDGVADPVTAAIGGGADGTGAGSGGGEAAGGDAGASLADLVSVQANVQSAADPSGAGLRQTAVRVAVLGGDVATVDIANAAVSSEAVDGVVPPTVPPGADTPVPETTAYGSLAFTGFVLIPMLLLGAALLGLGAWLVARARRAALLADSAAR